MNLITEIYQLLFISSIIFMIYIVTDLIMKIVGRFTQKSPEIRFSMTNTERIILWISIGIFFSYIIT